MKDHPVLECRGLSFSYDDYPVLHGLSFTLEAGEFVGVVGPNGSGKTTLLKLILRLLDLPEGAAFLDGRDILTWPRTQLARSLAYLPQFFDTDFAFSVRDIVIMGRNPHLGPFSWPGQRDMELADEALADVDALHLAEKRIQHLSGGESQRVMLARALCQDAPILLADEPTSHLDLRHQAQILSLLRKFNRERGQSVLAVFHDLNHAFTFCDRVLVLKDGQRQGLGPPGAVLRPELIRRVYGVRAWLVDAPDGRRKHMIPELHVATPSGAGGASGADGATVPAEGGTSQTGDPSSREEET